MTFLNSLFKKPLVLVSGVTVTAAAASLLAPTEAPVLAAPPKSVLEAEKQRIEVIAKVKPAVAAVCFHGGQACGSGVVISEDGYCLTNFHVVQPTGPVMQCGLADGKLYDSVLVGQDKIGDVALVKLLPKKEGDKFPFVKLGNSDEVKAGDWSLAMGNPFGLSLDFTPTVTFGLVSGVNRYQPPEGKGTLEYTDCIQIDTSINPGNSGGPLFNMKGELIGINGRGSFEKRGRVNSGVGYAISINQIKNFMGHMKSGLDTDHATLGALVTTENEDGDINKMLFSTMLEEADVARRGLKPGDQLTAFAGRAMTSTNQFKNVLGIYPAEWRLPLQYKASGETKRREMLVRLMGNMDKAVEKPMDPMMPPQPGPGPRPGPAPGPGAGASKSPAQKLYTAKKGFTNFYFNKLETEALVKAFQKHGDFTSLDKAVWKFEGKIQLENRADDCVISWTEDKEGATEVKMLRGEISDSVKPLSSGQVQKAEMMLPLGSGGLLASLDQYRRLLSKLEKGFLSNDSAQPGFTHAGSEPWYPMPTDGSKPESFESIRVDCQVLKTRFNSIDTKWYFSKKDNMLIGGEVKMFSEEDPCELYFGDYKDIGGRQLPHRIEVRHGDKRYGVITIRTWTIK